MSGRTEAARRRRRRGERRRRVSFGNPALGTYGGVVCTIDVEDGSEEDDCDDDDENDSQDEGVVTFLSQQQQQHQQQSSDSVRDGAGTGAGAKDGPGGSSEEHPTDRLVAMVEVPPEQVPEGVLNVVRGHRPNIEQVRIVISSEDDEKDGERSRHLSPEKQASSTPIVTEAGIGSRKPPPSPLPLVPCAAASDHSQYHAHNSGNGGRDGGILRRDRSPSISASLAGVAMEDAASIIAADEAANAARLTAMENLRRRPESEAEAMAEEEEEDHDEMEEKSLTYVILFLLSTPKAAAEFVASLNRQPYTSLEPDVTCEVQRVISIEGDGGVSLISPFFAPTEGAPPLVSTPLPKKVAAAASAGGGAVAAEAHNCAVCLESLDISPSCAGNEATAAAASSANSNETSTAIITTVCNHTFHIDCLLQWQDSPCPVCRYDHSGLNEALSQCHVCGTTENNYVCLICGVVSCGGRPGSNGLQGAAHDDITSSSDQGDETDCHSGNRNHTRDLDVGAIAQQTDHHHITGGHAREHYDETLHAYALDTETQHVWDFAGQGYVHRLIQNKDDGKIVEISDPTNTTSQERSLSPGLSDAQEGEVVHRKLEGFASQYYTLLKSQLEQQRIFYEGRLEEIRREHRGRKKGGTGKGRESTADHISALKQEKSQLEQRCVTLRRKYQKVSDDVTFLKDMNESLEANKDPMRRQIMEAQQKRAEMKKMMVACLPPLEEKVNLLMMQLEAASNMGCTEAEDGRNEDKKPAARRR